MVMTDTETAEMTSIGTTHASSPEMRPRPVATMSPRSPAVSIVSTTRALSLRLDRESPSISIYFSALGRVRTHNALTLSLPLVLSYLYYLIGEKNHDSLSNGGKSRPIQLNWEKRKFWNSLKSPAQPCLSFIQLGEKCIITAIWTHRIVRPSIWSLRKL